MTITVAGDSSPVSHDEVIVDLRATAHLRLDDDSRAVMVAGAGVVEIHSGGAGKEYEACENVMVYIRERQQQPTDRMRFHVSDICPIPPHLSFEDAASMVYPFTAGLSILYRELGITLTSMRPDDEIGDVRTSLILGGESAIGNALVQLLRIVLPSTALIVTCRAEDDETPPKDFEEAVRPFCRRVVEIGARYAIDASAPGLPGHLQAAIPFYGDSLQYTFDATGELARRPELLGLLDASGIIDCTQAAVKDALDRSEERVSMTDLGLVLAANELRPPLCSDMFVTVVT